ncbi:hypothetical protein [Moraxella lacunata]|uniref:hypothetical protein n=1 Tax=Moraxella lacunata TaxID=477 RepID=UPI003EE3BCA3
MSIFLFTYSSCWLANEPQFYPTDSWQACQYRQYCLRHYQRFLAKCSVRSYPKSEQLHLLSLGQYDSTSQSPFMNFMKQNLYLQQPIRVDRLL